jgi:hypothetical protein
MSSNLENLTSKEVLKHGDDIVSVKEHYTIEKAQNKRTLWFGMQTKDWIDALVKVAGLVGIVLAILSYNREVKKERDNQIKELKSEAKAARIAEEERNDKLRQRLQDSVKQILAEKEIQKRDLQINLENSRNDNALRLKQLEFYTSQARIDRAFYADQQKFRQQLAEIENSRIEVLKNSFSQTQLEIYLKLNNCLAELRNNMMTPDARQKTLQNFNALQLQVQLIKNDSLYILLNNLNKKVGFISCVFDCYSELKKLSGHLDEAVNITKNGSDALLAYKDKDSSYIRSLKNSVKNFNNLRESIADKFSCVEPLEDDNLSENPFYFIKLKRNIDEKLRYCYVRLIIYENEVLKTDRERDRLDRQFRNISIARQREPVVKMKEEYDSLFSSIGTYILYLYKLLDSSILRCNTVMYESSRLLKASAFNDN